MSVENYDRVWAEETLASDGLRKTLDLAIDRIEFFEANHKLAKGDEGWTHLDCTEALIDAVRNALPKRTQGRRKHA